MGQVDNPRQAGPGYWRVHGERPLYATRWLHVSVADVELPSGERFEHHVVRLARAAVVVVIDQGRVLMMWRHRFVPDRWGWELPGGLVEDGEDPIVTAAREVEEETGWRVREMTHLISFQPMVGMVDSEHSVFLGTGADQVGVPADDNESQSTEWIPLAEIPGLIAQGQIWSSGTLIGLLHILSSLHDESSGQRG